MIKNRLYEFNYKNNQNDLITCIYARSKEAVDKIIAISNICSPFYWTPEKKRFKVLSKDFDDIPVE